MKEAVEKIVKEGLEATAEKKNIEESVVSAAAELRENTGKNDLVFENTSGEWKEEEIIPVILEPKDIAFRGGLAACNWKCISSYCYPPDLAKGISTKNPNAPNTKIGHN